MWEQLEVNFDEGCCDTTVAGKVCGDSVEGLEIHKVGVVLSDAHLYGSFHSLWNLGQL